MEKAVFDCAQALDAEAREDFEMALELYNAAVAHALTPENQAEALFHRGSLYFRLEDYGNALSDLNNSLRLAPEESGYLWEALMNRGMSRALTGDLAGAEDDLVRSVALEPANGLAYLNLAGVKIRLGDKQGAAMCLSMAKTVFLQDDDDAGVEAAEGLMAQITEN